MNRKILLSVLTLALIIGGACKRQNDDELSHHNHTHEHPAHDHGQEKHEQEHDSDAESGSGEIVLPPASAARFGVAADTVRLTDFYEIINATGSVLASTDNVAVVSAPASGVVTLAHGVNPGKEVQRGSAIAAIDTRSTAGGDINQAAKATLDAARREYERLKPLYDEHIVTASEYNAARAAYEAAQAAYSTRASSGTAVSPIAGIVTALNVASGQYVEAGAPLATVASARTVTMRVDVPRRFARRVNGIADGYIRMAGEEEPFLISAAGGKRSASSAMPSSQTAGSYIPIYFTLPNDGRLLPGATFEAALHGAVRPGVVVLPMKSLSEQQGNYYVYRRLDEECYEKQLVKTGADNGSMVEIVDGVNPGDIIVVDGTTVVRLAEMSGVVPEGHNHNH